MGDEFYICEACRERVDEGDPAVVRTREQIRVDTLGDTTAQWIDGMGAFFHRGCYPRGGQWAGKRYRLLDD